MKLGLFADSHYSDENDPRSPRRHALSYDKIREAMVAFSGANVELVICLGDLVDDCGSREKNVEALRRLMTLIRSFSLPFFCLMGNHDYTNFTRAEFDSLTGGAVPPFSVVRDSLTLVFLDANYTRDGRVYEPGKVDWTDTKLPADQFDGLRAVLGRSAGRQVYVFSHQNLDPGVEAHHLIANASEIRALLAESGIVRAVISGHYHPGHDSESDGIRWHTLPAMCTGEANYYEILELGED